MRQGDEANENVERTERTGADGKGFLSEANGLLHDLQAPDGKGSVKGTAEI